MRERESKQGLVSLEKIMMRARGPWTGSGRAGAAYKDSGALERVESLAPDHDCHDRRHDQQGTNVGEVKLPADAREVLQPDQRVLVWVKVLKLVLRLLPREEIEDAIPQAASRDQDLGGAGVAQDDVDLQEEKGRAEDQLWRGQGRERGGWNGEEGLDT